MVYAFVLHTLLPGTCKVLFYQLYGIDGEVSESTDNNVERKSERKKQIEHIASQVHVSVSFLFVLSLIRNWDNSLFLTSPTLTCPSATNVIY